MLYVTVLTGTAPFVYRLGRQVFILVRGVRFPYGVQNNIGRLAEWSNALDLKSSILKGIVGSNPTSSANKGLVVQLVRISACHAEGRGFESRPDRFYCPIAQLVRAFA